jgi:hypothetical protein
MLTLWLIGRWRSFLRLFLVPPPGTLPQRINPNMPCRLCGHKGGTLRAVPVKIGRGENAIDLVAVRHTCNVCGGGYDYLPLTKDTAEVKHIFVPAQSTVDERLKLNGRAR